MSYIALNACKIGMLEISERVKHLDINSWVVNLESRPNANAYGTLREHPYIDKRAWDYLLNLNYLHFYP